VRAERDIYHEPLLKELAARHANFRYEVVLSGQSAVAGRRHGFVHEAVAADISGLTGYKAYLAGPPPMVEAANEWLLASGLPQRDIHADAFYDQA
jgi:CDP-4-dehydro-6-deoxyglucose reductase/ferredoxin-NAD(P)+ reductase (naphthalene dioxygenase ferredoxin-specific)